MVARVWDDLESLAASWKAEAERRVQVGGASDPAGTALGFAAAELTERLRLLKLSTAMLSTSEYGEARGVCAQTVRGWCGRGLLDGAMMIGGEWRIPREAPTPVTRQLARAS